MKIAVITANLGNFDPNIEYVEQSLPYNFYKFTDENFPPRRRAMTPRMQARIVKMFGWQMIPEHDFYIWVDSSCILSHKDSVKWFIEKCDGVDMAVFKHPERNTIQEEADYLKERLNKGDNYIVSRYENELLDEQLAVINKDKTYADQNLYASTAMVYKNNSKIQNVMFHWWHHTSRYHIIDQLSLPYILYKQNCTVRIIPENYTKIPYLKHIRNSKYAKEAEKNTAVQEYIKPEITIKKASVDNIPVTEELKDRSIQETIPEKSTAAAVISENNTVQMALKYWEEWLVGNGRAYEDPRFLLKRLMFMLSGKKEALIANIGAGPVNKIGNGKRGRNFTIVASDPLADEYAKMLEKLGQKPVNPVEKQDMENLSYESDKFDVVYSENALNYQDNPYKALQEMLRVCKPGGYIYLRHKTYTGRGGRPLGRPKWDVNVTESGGCVFSNVHAESEIKSFALSEVYPAFANNSEELPKGELITSFVKKV